jgi:hypothetical protein
MWARVAANLKIPPQKYKIFPNIPRIFSDYILHKKIIL